jgi:predicted nucleic acid-binding protein
MIVLDTNVLSELMRLVPTDNVARWVDSQPATSLFTTSITQAEILYGLMLLPGGRRRKALELASAAMFEELFAGRILPFGMDAARPYAVIGSERRRKGVPISQFDAQIAAIVRSVGATLATRNVADFQGCGIELVDPWQ